jgi:hypothetical protein
MSDNTDSQFYDVLKAYEEDTDNLFDIRDESDSRTSLEMVEQERFRFFLYSHPRDTKEYIHSTAGNYLNKNKDMSFIFAMSIGIDEFKDVIDKEPYTLTKNKKYTNVFRPPSAVLHQEILRRAHFIVHQKYSNAKENPLYLKGKIEMPRLSYNGK